MYLLVLGFGLGPVFEKAGQGDYLQFVAPGVVGMTILFSSIFSGVGLLWDRQFGFLKETLVAPVPRIQIMIGRTLGGATTATIQGTLVLIVCLIAGFRPHDFGGVLLGFLFMVLIAIVFAALGTIIGSGLKDMQGFQLVMNFLVMPIFFLSGPSTRCRTCRRRWRCRPASTRCRTAWTGCVARSSASRTSAWRPTSRSSASSRALFLALGARAFSRIQVSSSANNEKADGLR